MKRIMLAACAVSVLTLPLAVLGADVPLNPSGTVGFGERGLVPFMYLKGWKHLPVVGAYEISVPGRTDFRMTDGKEKIFDGSVSLVRHEGGSLKLEYVFTAAKPVEVQSFGCKMSLPHADAEGLAWETESRSGRFARPAKGLSVASGKCTSFGFSPGAGKERLVFFSRTPFAFTVQDNRRWRDTYEVRFYPPRMTRRFAAGETVSFRVMVKSASALTPVDVKPYTVEAGAEWIPVDFRRDILEGSALDFSRMGFTDAPAGKHGWLRNVGGHFEFGRLPGKRQRFYGVNLCSSANFPDRDLARRLVTRLRRFGYNTIRIHHHDAEMTRGSADGVSLNPAAMEKFDGLVAEAVRQGLYLTTDVYVSRAHNIGWRHIGVDRDGTVPMRLYKALCAVHEPAFRNWAAFAKNFFMHVNPHTGRRYADEPAMPLVSLVNEGGFFMGWKRGVCDDERVLASWKKWLAKKRAADPSFAPAADPDRLPGNFRDPATAPAIAAWTGELEAEMSARMKAYLRSIGVKALVTNGNCGSHYAALQLATAGYDYIDDHFYVDHPRFLEKRWRLPSSCPNVNPLLGSGTIRPADKAFTRMDGKPFTVTEWNFSGPGRYRGVGGILTGAMAALQDWDGLWRFAYSHNRENLGDTDASRPGYFDLVSDPLASAGERACLCLFLRGDLAPLDGGVSLMYGPESASRPDKVLIAAPPWSDMAWKMRVGSCLSPDDARGTHVIAREKAESADVSRFVRETPLAFDRKRGSFTVSTDRTCGGFAPEGTVSAGFLSADISGAPATVWVSSLDGKAIPESGRLLVSHVTDVQGEGVKFTDRSMRILLKWGRRPLAQNGSAVVSVDLRNPGDFEVWGLAANGRRTGRMASSVTDGRLVFTASVDAPGGARMLYEIVRRRP